MSGARAATLQVCPPEVVPQGAIAQGELIGADGSRSRLYVGEAEGDPRCPSFVLEVPPDAIKAVRIIASEARLGERLIFYGEEQEGRVAIRNIDFGEVSAATPATPATEPILPVGSELLSKLEARAFGADERARLESRAGALHLECAAGERVAGVILTAQGRMPLASTRIRVLAAGQGQFEFQVADRDLAARESAIALGTFGLERDVPVEAAVAWPARGFEREQWRHFVLLCPQAAGRMRIDSVQLQALPQPVPGRAAWMWRSMAWSEQAEATLAFARRHDLRTLFISVPVIEGKVSNAAVLRAFVEKAGKQGIAVWSVDGDPQMILPSEHSATVARVAAYARYNAEVPPRSRIGGMQFDIEPYLMPGYELDREGMEGNYLALLVKLRAAAGNLPLEVVLPFWGLTPSLAQKLPALVSGVTVMNYRSDPHELRTHAAPFLDWGARHGKPVRIALEAGPIAPERQWRFRRATQGELWAVRAPNLHALVLLRSARANPHGLAYALEGTRTLDGKATTFHADVSRLWSLLPALEKDLAAWSSFAGIALHELPD
ncbi:MAG TPA: hypothetical protein VJM53_10025 [Burkholderiales bacterium]|nr:hypothetical protein [Burkholderiales bacterium]